MESYQVLRIVGAGASCVCLVDLYPERQAGRCSYVYKMWPQQPWEVALHSVPFRSREDALAAVRKHYARIYPHDQIVVEEAHSARR